MTHLDSLNLILSNERMRLNDAKSEGEKELRRVFVAQLEKEINGEQEFFATGQKDISDDELLNELFA